MTLDIRRDPSVYGDVHFRLFNPNEETFVTHETIFVDGQEATSDATGNVSLFIPLESQRKVYPVNASIHLLNDSIHMPCGDDDVILTQ